MPRSKKATVDYFPHSCLHGRTLHIIESKFANDGYAFWFKLLESLGSTENHFIDCNDPATWEYLLAQTRVSGETAESILGLLASLGAIRSEFWKMRIVWSENFVKNLEAVYQRRRIDVFTVNDIEAYCKQKYSLSGINVNINPQSKVKESKVDKSKVKESKADAIASLPPDLRKTVLEFADFRKKLKKPMTDRAIELLVAQLFKLSDTETEQVAIMNQSIMNGWTSIYPLKDNARSNQQDMSAGRRILDL